MLTDIFTTSNKYSIIYADPPWQFKAYSDKGKGRSADCHYPTMSKGEIENLPIQNIAAKDSILFLWVTAPCLIEGIELISAWGFTYKTVAFTWIKQNKKADSIFKGMGYYILLSFSEIYDMMDDTERKNLMSYLIKRIDIYANDEGTSQILKSIEFNFPIYKDGAFVRKILWDESVNVETLVCLKKQG